jgi:hypothetical protein
LGCIRFFIYICVVRKKICIVTSVAVLKKIVLGNLLITCVAVNKKKKDTAHWQPPPPRSDPVRRRRRGEGGGGKPGPADYPIQVLILLPLAMAYIRYACASYTRNISVIYTERSNHF